jgi:hypothetical protein
MSGRYKLCKSCGQPMLKKGQKRKHPDDYRHAAGCPLDAQAKQKANAVLEVRSQETTPDGPPS